MKKRLVVYTAVYAGRDPIRIPPADRDFDFFAFTDSEDVQAPWVVRASQLPHEDPVRSARAIKALPEARFNDYRYSLWIDGSILLKTGALDHLVDRYLSGSAPLATFQHPSRTCAYQEASVCLSTELDAKELILGQIRHYRQCQFPEGRGLAETSVVLRDHERTGEFSSTWWEEISRWSRRDQISFPFAAWKTGLEWARFVEPMWQNEYFQSMPHN